MTQVSNNILQDQIKDQQLFALSPEQYTTTLMSRIQRRNLAYDLYIKSIYQTYPRGDLLNLKNLKSKLQAIYANRPTNEILQKIEEIQTTIDNQDYCLEGSDEYNIRQQYLTHAANFQWPDSAELALRQQEETELLALLG